MKYGRPAAVSKGTIRPSRSHGAEPRQNRVKATLLRMDKHEIDSLGSQSRAYDEFCRNLLAYLSAKEYRFVLSESGLTPVQAKGFWASMLNPGLAGAVLYGPLFAGTAQSSCEPELRGELVELQKLCRFVGCKIVFGHVRIEALIEADGKSKEELIGAFSLFHEGVLRLRRFSTETVNTWGFWKKLSPTFFDSRTVWGRAFVAFNQSASATDFQLNSSALCKHRTGACWTLPITVDIPAQRIEKWRGMPFDPKD